MTTEPAIVVTDLVKVYGRAGGRRSVKALDGVSIQVGRGEIFGLLGPNGAGKTTLIKILLGIVRPSSGFARLFGIDVRDPRARLPVGYLAENHRFPDFLTAGQNMDIYGRLSDVPRDTRAGRSKELLNMLKIGEWREQRVKKFSKGMSQRLGLAQALLNDPELIFLDEPTDGVDPIGRREIRDLLLSLKEEGKTIFINSHLLSEVEQVCDRVAILNRGELVSQGAVGDFTTLERVYDIVSTPIPETLIAQIDSIAPTAMANEGIDDTLRKYRVTAPDRAALNDVLDRLRAGGVHLESINASRQTLEDFFVGVVSAGSQAEGLGGMQG